MQLTGKVDVRVATVAHTMNLDSSSRPPITGMNGRWPAGTLSNAALWNFSGAGSNGVGYVPTERWANDEKVHAAHFLGFVRKVELFESARFAISPAEAAWMDPQQRLLLEHGDAALLTSGTSRADMQQADIGVFLGTHP